MATASTTPMTIEQFLALPEDDGITRELIRGELREHPMTTRNSKHALVVGRIAQTLNNWLDNQPNVFGVVGTGEVRCRLTTNPTTIVGIDVGLFLGDEAASIAERGNLLDSPPVLAVEVLSPSDTHENLIEKIHLYLEAQVPQVWIIDPDFQTVTVHRPHCSPAFFNREQILTAAPELPNFQVEVSHLFRAKRNHPA